jgi:hypothetical protein
LQPLFFFLSKLSSKLSTECALLALGAVAAALFARVRAPRVAAGAAPPAPVLLVYEALSVTGLKILVYEALSY